MMEVWNPDLPTVEAMFVQNFHGHRCLEPREFFCTGCWQKYQKTCTFERTNVKIMYLTNLAVMQWWSKSKFLWNASKKIFVLFGRFGRVSGVGVTKAPFVNFSVRDIFNLAEAHVRLFKSNSYLTGITAAELRWHLSNINVIFNR